MLLYFYCFQMLIYRINQILRTKLHYIIIRKMIINDESEQQGIQMIQNKEEPEKELTLDDIPEHVFHTVFKITQQHLNKSSVLSNRLSIYSKIYIDPTAFKTGVWDFVMIFVAYFLLFQISLTLAFGPQFFFDEIGDSYSYIITYSCLIFFLIVDIFICFHKGYYAFGRGKIIDDHDLIIKHYLKIHFPIDFSCIIILLIPLIYSNYILNWLQVVPACLLYIKKFKCQQQIVATLQYRKYLRIFFILFMLMCDVLLIGNFGACIFVGLDLLLWRTQYYGNNPAYYWLSNNSAYSNDLIDGSWILQYVFAQSFSTGTLSTLAPGPFGKNPIEIMYAIILMTFFMLLASYVGQVLINTLYTEEQIRIFHENNIQRFDQFMKLKEVTLRIKNRVYNFFELIWEVQVKMSVERQKQILQKLPTNLKNELLVEMGFIKQAKFLNYFKSKDGKLIERLSNKITTYVVDADSLIFTENKLVPEENRMIYYFKEGIAKCFFTIKHSEEILSLSNVQKTMGTYQFLTGQSYHFSCKSIDLCSIQKLNFSDFIAIIETNNLLEKYYELKYEVMVEEKLDKINKQCIICNEYHTENSCEEIDYGLYTRNQFKEKGGILTQKRKSFKRKSPKKKKTVGKDPTLEFEGKKLLPFIFAKVGGLGGLLKKINQLTMQNVEEVENYKNYFPKFNM